MANKEVAIGIKVDTSDSVKTLGDLENALKEVDKVTDNIAKDNSLEARFDALNKEISEAPVNIRAMNKQIQEYQAIALEAGRTSPLGQKALAEAAAMRDRYVDIQNEVKRLSDDGLKMQAALDLGTSVMAGYTAFQGALALSGVESEELQKTLVKLQAAQSVLMGLEQIRTTLEKESTVVLMARNAVEKIGTFIKGESAVASGSLAAAEGARATATAGATAATAGATAGLNIFRLALIATGIGAIIVGLGLLIINFDKVKEAVVSAAQWVQGLAKQFREMDGWVQVLIGYLSFGLVPAISYLIGALEKFGIVETEEMRQSAERRKKQLDTITRETEKKVALIQAEIDAEKKRSDEITSALDWEIEKKKAAGEDYAELEKQKLEAIIKTTREQAKLLKEQIKAEAEALVAKNKIIAQGTGFAATVAQKALEEFGGGDAYINQILGNDESLLALEATLDQAEKDLQLFNIKQEKLKKDQIKKNAEEKKKADDKELADEKKKQDELLKIEKDRKAKELAEAKKNQEELEKLVKDFRFRQMTEQQQELQTLKDKYLQEQELAHGNKAILLQLEREYNNNVSSINQKYQDERDAAEKERIQKEKEERISAAEASFNGLKDLNNAVLEAELAAAGDNEQKKQEIRKKAFKRQKALDLADATIQGIKAVQSALASPFPFNIALAAINGATAAANIAKIASVQFEGESGGGASGGNLANTGRATNGANVPQVTNTTTSIGEPTKVFVTEQDISNTQNKVQVAESQATL